MGLPNLSLPSPPKRRNKECKGKETFCPPRAGAPYSSHLLRRGLELLFHHTSISPPVRPPGPPKACHPVLGAPQHPALCVGVKATSAPNSRPHDLSLVPAPYGRSFAWCLPIWCGVGRDVIAVLPNTFLCVVGRRAAVLRFCFQQPLWFD